MKSGQGIASTGFLFPGQTAFYKGSVRDVYAIRNKLLVMVVTDRISAFDVVLPVTVPHKGQVLSQIAVHFLEATKDIVPNWFITAPDPNVVIGQQCEAFKIEMVIRGYLVGHAWREYRAGKRELCGVALPDGLKENDKFPEPIITPATHAAEGHDEDISAAEIVSRGLIPADDYKIIEQYTRQLFARGTALAAERGLMLVDTKYEFGKKDGQIYLIDEVHTPDSSRYFYADGYENHLAKGEPQRQLSKEFIREWLIAHDFQGLTGQTMPDIPDDFVQEASSRYVELYEQLTGKKFVPPNDAGDPIARIKANVLKALEKL
ncbi:MAG TPA: phosphoribosylaminoimidazolesuccinocarboxamide synthase [Candidatus Saccharimonadales bacterium]|jgi:phosphoribosylaminoimidazole-succinocarboxamide synthase|nr:phosphoribosylaminoimidazolesuccinocarboxamide synthase [Candidatus Saccharimonadales bacterium]